MATLPLVAATCSAEAALCTCGTPKLPEVLATARTVPIAFASAPSCSSRCTASASLEPTAAMSCMSSTICRWSTITGTSSRRCAAGGRRAGTERLRVAPSSSSASAA
eukprot:5876772-Prymnesium_polylepis.1